ncbi:MAG TPA: protease complex subunit PrcB family protein [Longimicrobium sp.]|nr:protease complex subunit PrcB family protein [Longimicrobium sp.]
MKPTAVLATIVVLAACEGGLSRSRDRLPDTPPPVSPPTDTRRPPAEIPEAIASFCRPARQARADALPAGAAEVPARTVNEGDSRLDAPMDCVIRTPAEWTTLVSTGQIHNLPAMASVRFDREVVLVSSQGRQPSTGYSIQIDTVAESGGTLIAVVHSRWPEGGVTLAALTSPFTAVAVPAPADSVVFLRRP